MKNKKNKNFIELKTNNNDSAYVNPDNICAIYGDSFCGDPYSVIVFGSEAISVKDSVHEVLDKINGM